MSSSPSMLSSNGTRPDSTSSTRSRSTERVHVPISSVATALPEKLVTRAPPT